MIRLDLFLMCLCMSVFWSCAQQASRAEDEMEQYLPSRYPDRVLINVGFDWDSRVVNWRVDTTAAPQTIQWTVSDASSNLEDQAAQAQAVSQKLETESVTAVYNSYEIKNLRPGKTYVYRVGAGEYWSEWFQFRVEEMDNEFSFVYLGDAQNDMRDLWSRSARMAYTFDPDAELWLHLGDMVDNARNNWEWGEWYYGGGWMMAQVAQVPIPGNHEYISSRNGPVINKYWRPSFSLPDNGPEGLKEVVYYFDYQNIRFVILDSRNMLVSEDLANLQAEWLEKVLAQNTQTWTVVCHHHPIHSARPNRKGYGLEEYLVPIYNKYKVDLVLQGHHHSFARGRGVQDRGKPVQSGPIYFVSNSGPKMYDSNFGDWMERVATNVQLFHSVKVKDEQLEVYTYLVNGELYDHIELKKLPNGDKEFKEIEVEDVKERIDYPTSTYGADIDKSGNSKALFEERAKEYLLKRKSINN